MPTRKKPAPAARKAAASPASDQHVRRTASGQLTQRSSQEVGVDGKLQEALLGCLPLFGEHWGAHLALFLKRQALSRLIYYYELYKRIVHVPGVICEFGVQWGATLATLSSLRGMFEPFNHSRKIVGFDTFEGFATVGAADGTATRRGDYATGEQYQVVLEELLSMHESLSPLSHIKKHELVKGDASETVPQWLCDNPHAIIAMAIFDMDVYAPTKAALTAILPRLTKGSLLVFDELSCQHFPGETVALSEVLGIPNLRLRRFEHQPFCSFAVYGE